MGDGEHGFSIGSVCAGEKTRGGTMRAVVCGDNGM